MTLLLASVASALAIGGCQLLVGLEDEYRVREDVRDDGGALDDGGATPLERCPGREDAVCTPGAIPEGWTVVAYGSRENDCPAGFGAPQAVDEESAASCACDCEGAPACSFQVSTFMAGSACTTPSGTPFRVTNTCADVPGSTLQSLGSKLEPVSMDGGCTGRPRIVRAAPSSGGHVCSAAPSGSSEACGTGHGVCVSDPGPYHRLCLAHEGSVDCPAGFGSPVRVGRDVRSCGACSCQPNATSCTASLALTQDDLSCASANVLLETGKCNDPIEAEMVRGVLRVPPRATASCVVVAEPILSSEPALEAQKTLCCP